MRNNYTKSLSKQKDATAKEIKESAVLVVVIIAFVWMATSL